MTVIHLGSTGTQHGATALQHAAAANLILTLGEFVAHHGDCTGWDKQFHEICLDAPGCLALVIHPPIDEKKRAFCDRIINPRSIPITVLPAKEYLVRNRDIVKGAQRMVGVPKEQHVEELRSGTWATIRTTRAKGKPLVVVWPDGTIKYEEWP